jgi:hypothetical protein
MIFFDRQRAASEVERYRGGISTKNLTVAPTVDGSELTPAHFFCQSKSTAASPQTEVSFDIPRLRIGQRGTTEARSARFVFQMLRRFHPVRKGAEPREEPQSRRRGIALLAPLRTDRRVLSKPWLRVLCDHKPSTQSAQSTSVPSVLEPWGHRGRREPRFGCGWAARCLAANKKSATKKT